MKIPSVSRLFSLVVFLHAGAAVAQSGIDPTTATLFQGGTGAGSPEPEDLDSSRFTVTSPTPAPPPPVKHDPVVVIKKKKKQETSTKIEVHPTPRAVLAPASETPPVVAPTRPSLTEQVKVLLLGKEDDIESFQKQIHPSDRRNNLLDIAVAPTFVYGSSMSNYSFRNFTFQSPGLDANAHVWLTPFFGIQGHYVSTFGAHIKSPQLQQMVALKYEDMEFGLRFRKHFGVTRKSSSLTWGLDFVQYKESLAADTVDRVSTQTSGLALNLQADLPMSLGYSTFLGVELQPRMVHSEISDANIHSGGKNDTNTIGAWIGGDIIFDRQRQMFWKLHERIEQNVFDGNASMLDPVTGVTPNGVSTTNSTTLFSIGYRWGS